MMAVQGNIVVPRFTSGSGLIELTWLTDSTRLTCCTRLPLLDWISRGLLICLFLVLPWGLVAFLNDNLIITLAFLDQRRVLQLGDRFNGHSLWCLVEESHVIVLAGQRRGALSLLMGSVTLTSCYLVSGTWAPVRITGVNGQAKVAWV